MDEAVERIFETLREVSQSGAPLYLQLKRNIEDAIRRGLIQP